MITQKNRFLKLFVCLISIFAMNASLSYASEQIVLRAFYEDKEQPPYYLGTGSTIPEKPGVAVDMVKTLEEYVPGLKVEFTRTPWSRCLAELEANTADAIFNSSYNESRLKIGRYPTVDGTDKGEPDKEKRITTISYFLYKPKKVKDLAWNGEKFINLGPWKLGATLGYSIINDLEKMKIPVDKVSGGTPAILKMLVNNRFPGAVLQEVTADSLIARNSEYSEKLVKDKIPVVSKEYYLMLSHDFVKKHPGTAESIWNAMETIRKEKFEEITAKYNLE